MVKRNEEYRRVGIWYMVEGCRGGGKARVSGTGVGGAVQSREGRYLVLDGVEECVNKEAGV